MSYKNLDKNNYIGYNKNKFSCDKKTINKHYGTRPSIIGRKLNVPIPFWFSKNNGLGLPLISLQYHEVLVEVQFKPVKELYTIKKPDKKYYYYKNDNHYNITVKNNDDLQESDLDSSTTGSSSIDIICEPESEITDTEDEVCDEPIKTPDSPPKIPTPTPPIKNEDKCKTQKNKFSKLDTNSINNRDFMTNILIQNKSTVSDNKTKNFPKQMIVGILHRRCR